MGAVEWSEYVSHRQLTFQKSQVISPSKSSWRSAFGKKIYESGVHRWEVKFDRDTAKKGYLMVGVAISTWDTANYLGERYNNQSWSYYGYNGVKYPKAQKYGEKYGEGDVITIVLNLDNR